MVIREKPNSRGFVPDCAMVLAAGLGLRMRPLTQNLPKPLLEVGGATMLDHALDRFDDVGVSEVVVNTHWLAKKIHAHLERRTTPSIVISSEEELLETGGGIAKALPYLGDAPFYAAIRQHVVDGAIGQVLNIQAVEHVSYHHMAVGFIRGKWSRIDYCQSPMLMAKSCHDLDLIAWMKSGVAPTRVASFGSNFQFRPENAPAGAGSRCLVDCPIEKECSYSARKHYIDHPERWSFYVWDSLEHIEAPTLADKLASLETSPYGQCVWKTDMDVVDHQSVAIEFADGCTATLNMIGGSPKPSRSIHLLGTEGEIQGNLEESTFALRHIDPRPGREYEEQIIDVNVQGDMTGASGGHGGGDMRLVADFLKLLDGAAPSISTTTIEDSISGHLIGFCADRSMRQSTTVTIPTTQEKLV